MEIFHIHIDKTDHCLTADEFIQTVNSAKLIYNNLVKDLLNDDSGSELSILAPKEGGVDINLVINISSQTSEMVSKAGVAIAAAGFILKFIESKIGIAIIKQNLGKDPVYYVEHPDELLKDLLIFIYIKPVAEIKKLIDDLKEFNADIVKLDASIKAKSDFYKICISNKEINGVGFDSTEDFAIKKNDFINHLSTDIIRDLKPVSKYKELVVVKPVAVNRKDKWILEDSISKELKSYSMQDKHFQELTLNGNFLKKSKQDDKIIALVEYIKELKNGVETTKERRINQVYKLNEESIKDLPEDFELDKANIKEDSNKQLGFFDNNKEE